MTCCQAEIHFLTVSLASFSGTNSESEKAASAGAQEGQDKPPGALAANPVGSFTIDMVIQGAHEPGDLRGAGTKANGLLAFLARLRLAVASASDSSLLGAVAGHAFQALVKK
jgi:hypothetical protein